VKRVRLSELSAPTKRPGVVSDAIAFWGAGALLGVFLFAAAAPSPLYGIYAARWHFSSLTLTIVFALYAVGLLFALQVGGRLSRLPGASTGDPNLDRSGDHRDGLLHRG
jgi:hypothetical protein